MKRDAYLKDSDVRKFIKWATPFVTGERLIAHCWENGRGKEWSCDTIYQAYEKYDWPFSVVLPGERERRRCHSFAGSVAVFEYLRPQLQQRDSPEVFLAAAIAVVEWGGVRQNRRRLRNLGNDALFTLTDAQQLRLLDPETANLDRLEGVPHINSGFSKIYSLLIDGFPIYDSRVACALASLVRGYCEEQNPSSVPDTLKFRIPQYQAKVCRNPSTDTLRFPTLWHGSPRRYAESNIKAAWLLGELAMTEPFAELDHPMLALQSAMFMLGYTCMTVARE